MTSEEYDLKQTGNDSPLVVAIHFAFEIGGFVAVLSFVHSGERDEEGVEVGWEGDMI